VGRNYPISCGPGKNKMLKKSEFAFFWSKGFHLLLSLDIKILGFFGILTLGLVSTALSLQILRTLAWDW
jgi:hypothetical protein